MAGVNIFPGGIPDKKQGVNIFPDGIPDKKQGVNIFPGGIPESQEPEKPEAGTFIETAEKEYKEGSLKPALTDLAEAATIGTLESIVALGTGIPLWMIGKLRGAGELMRGHTVEEARKVEEDIAAKGYQPKTESAKQAMGMVGQAMDVITWPARKFGETAEAYGYPRIGYLTELAGMLATFKAMGPVKGKGAAKIKETQTARAVFDSKMRELTEPQRAEVRKIAETKATGKGDRLATMEKWAKLTPMEKSYEILKDLWFRKKDRRVFEADIEARLLKKEIKQASNKKIAPLYDDATQIYIDLKNHPDHLGKYYDALNPRQKKIVDLSRSLPPEIKAVADKIAKSYEVIGREAWDATVIRNMIENYAARQWDLGPGKSMEALKKFGTTTRHAKARRLGTILEGWAEGYDLKIKSGTENLRIYKHELLRTMADKDFVSELKKIKDLDGNPLLTTDPPKGLDYVQLRHPNMTSWEWAGKVEEGKIYGKNSFITDDGVVFEKRQLHAPKREAKNLNNILGISRLADVPGVKGITKFNEITKAWILQSSLFHHQAFLRSFYLPSGLKGKGLTPRQAYKSGIKAIETSDPVLLNLVENGLTIGLRQDWVEPLLRESTHLGRLLDKNKATKIAKDKITKFREAQADFLFGEFGAGLKAKTAILEFRDQMRKYPDANPNVVAARVARMVNDDFGGLHLGRLGRNPTLQHIFRLFALAPDWTESNVRTMVKTMKNMTGDQAELHMYRKFWGGVVLKSVGVTALANYALAGGDVDKMMKNYEKAWKSGNFNWMKTDITPIYEGIYNMVGATPSGQSKYFPIAGHFLDPAKFVAHTSKAFKHKQSVVGGIGLEYFTGTDYTGVRRFTTIEELLKEGKTVKWGGRGHTDWEQFPSYALSQLMGTQPIQVQALMGWMAGEKDAFDAIGASLGLRITTTYEQRKRMKRGLRKLKGIK